MVAATPTPERMWRRSGSGAAAMRRYRRGEVRAGTRGPKVSSDVGGHLSKFPGQALTSAATWSVWYPGDLLSWTSNSQHGEPLG